MTHRQPTGRAAPAQSAPSRGDQDGAHARLVVGPYLNERHNAAPKPPPSGRLTKARSSEARIAEARGLAAAIDVDVVGTEIVSLTQIRPATYLGQGKVEEIAARTKDEAIDLVIMDCALSPVQQRNLEKAFDCKVIDRTGLILEIFGRRALTREGTLQVELAHLNLSEIAAGALLDPS